MARAATARRPGADTKREAIFDAALELFGRYGYRRTSIDDIARAAGVAKGTVYLYVENKEALFRTLAQSLLDGVLENARAAAGRGGDVAGRPRDLGREVRLLPRPATPVAPRERAARLD
jgi:AcrR family transcriptional regulator